MAKPRKKATPKKKPAAKPTARSATKKAAPPSKKAAAKTAARGGSAGAHKSASVGKKAAVKGAGSEKASLKSGGKKDVKLSAGKSMKSPAGASAMKKGVETKGVGTHSNQTASAASGAAPAASAASAKGKKSPAAKKASAPKSAPKNYEEMCREIACESHSTTAGYCRLHYIKNWKKIKRKELILREKKLNQYIEELVSKYPDKYIEAIKQDLADETAFSKVIYDLELDESVDDIPVDDENDEAIIDNIKREFDEGDGDF